MDKDDTRERLIRIAAHELARHGFQGMSLRKVAAKAGIGAATVFHHFPGGKQALYLGTVSHIMAEMMELAGMRHGDLEGLSPADIIATQAERFWDVLGDKPELAAMLLREAFDDEVGPEGALQTHASGVVELAERYIQDAQKAGELGDFDARHFLAWASSYVVTFHGAPGIHRHILGERMDAASERALFTKRLRAYLRGELPG